MAKQRDPHVGIKRFALKASERYRRIVSESAVWAHEVVEGHEKSGQRNDAIEVFEAGAWSSVELVGAIETFDQLLECAVSFALGIEVFQADNSVFREHVISGVLASGGIISDDGAVVRRQAIGDQAAEAAFRGAWRAVATGEQSQSRFDATGVGDVISADGAVTLSDDEPGVMGKAFDLDIGFIGRTCADRLGAVCIDELAEIGGGSVDVVDDRLVRDGDVKHARESLRGHSSAEAEADGEGKAQTNGMQVVMDAVKINGSIRRPGRREIISRKMIFSE